MAEGRIPLYYTFGNHQHWVDFHWLWSYEVLPDAVDDMVKFCDATDAGPDEEILAVRDRLVETENPMCRIAVVIIAVEALLAAQMALES
jgi:alpha-mannosidase